MRLFFILLFALALAGCGGNTNDLCGSPGQPCCGSGECKEGALCGADLLCTACGGLDQACCADDVCSGTLACVAHTACQEPLSCPTNCTLGTQRCANNGIETCTSGGVCPVWTNTLPACPSGAICMEAASQADCVEACPGACIAGSLVCSTTGLQKCVQGGACTQLVSTPDDFDRPQCLTGAVVSADFAWESPTPSPGNFRAVVGQLPSSYFVLDGQGNILHYVDGTWTYELRGTFDKRVDALTACNPSNLYAVGRNGVVFRRSVGEWLEERAGSSDLRAVWCDNQGVYAAGHDGKLYVRGLASSATWAAYDTRALADGGTPSYEALTHLFSFDQVFLGGTEGRIVRCNMNPLPPTCIEENSTVSVPLLTMTSDSASNTVYAGGQGGTLLLRGANWSKLPLPDITSSIVSLAARYNGLVTELAALSEAGEVAAFHGFTRDSTAHIPGALALASVDDTNLVAVGQFGATWQRPGIVTTIAFTARGRQPIDKALNAVADLGNRLLVAVGEGGARYRRQNDTWSLDTLGASTSADLTSLVVRNANEVYAFGNTGAALVRRYGVWVVEPVGTLENLKSAAIDSTTVWVLGQHKLFFKDLLKGTWDFITLPDGAEPTTLALRRDANGHATELTLFGLRCATWSVDLTSHAITAGPGCNASFDFNVAAFSPTGELYLGTYDGRIVHRVGGAYMLEQTASTLEPLNTITFDGASVWFAGRSGSLLRKVNNVWTEVEPELTSTEWRGSLKDPDLGLFFVGVNGAVLRRY